MQTKPTYRTSKSSRAIRKASSKSSLCKPSRRHIVSTRNSFCGKDNDNRREQNTVSKQRENKNTKVSSPRFMSSSVSSSSRLSSSRKNQIGNIQKRYDGIDRIRAQKKIDKLSRDLTRSRFEMKNVAVVISIIFAIILLAGTFLKVGIDNAHADELYDLPTKTVVVHAGDTIEGIASENVVEGYSIHEMSYAIGEINKDSRSNPLSPGDVLEIPYRSS